MQCPFYLGARKLTRAQVVERLVIRELARVAQLSAHEAFSLPSCEFENDTDTLWVHFEGELTLRSCVVLLLLLLMRRSSGGDRLPQCPQLAYVQRHSGKTPQ